jgi:AcrR family transcriptional regulator
VTTPRAELERIRCQQAAREPEIRAQIMEAMLLCSGESGYRRVAVQQVYQRYGGYRAQFYRHFASKTDCFTAAYGVEAERICERLLSFVEADGDTTDRLEAALGDLLDFVAKEPALAKAIFVEVHVVGEPALTKRMALVRRLARAIDESCRGRAAKPSPPPTSGEFVVGAVEQAVAGSLLRDDPQELVAAVPELARIFADIYSLGD